MSRNFKNIILLAILITIVLINIFMREDKSTWSGSFRHNDRRETRDERLGAISSVNRRLQQTNNRIQSSSIHIHDNNLKDANQTLGKKIKTKAYLEGKLRGNNVQKSPYVDPKLFVNTTGEIENKLSILMWNAPPWMKSNWYADVDFSQCTYKNCKMVHAKWRIRESNAVMFSLSQTLEDRGLGPEPPVSANLRNPDQAWIFFTLEPPIYLVLGDYRSPGWQNAFNWSWTYRVDSDISHPYGILQTRREIPEKNYSEIFRRKSKMAAWAVSHCKTEAKREDYVKMMQRYMAVDIYGDCGSSYPDDFLQILESDYKFYIGFENSFCPDYITEKFFQYYKNDVIVVVRGGGSYNKYLPKGSFVNADDFPDVKALTDHLQALASDENEYIKYLKIKDQFDVKEGWFLFRDALCNICDKLNNLESNRKTYKDIVEWYGQCHDANDLH